MQPVDTAAPRAERVPASYTLDGPVRPADAFRPDIEGLRGVAVMLVVAYHAGMLGVTGGYVGVDVFFVLSGFLITGILRRQVERTGGLDLPRFYARRVLRLLPAAALVLLATLAVERLRFGPMERIEMSLSGIATALYGSNVYFMARATDYFSTGAESNALLHTWSLAVEEQFYLVWPLLVLVASRLTRSRRGFALALAAFTVASLAGAVWLTQVRQPWAFFGMPARAWEFGAGGLAAMVPTGLAGARGRWVGPLGWAGLAAIVASAYLLHPNTPFPGTAALLPTLGTVAVLVAGSVATAGVGRLLSTRALQWVGARSYTWYLWHWPVLVLAGAATAAWWVRAGWMLAALALAAATTALVENPLRFHPRLRPYPRRALLLGAACTLASAAVALVAWRDADAHGHAFAAAAKENTRMANDGCIADFDEARPRECVYGTPTGTPTVVLLGDSHANQWFPALDAVARDAGWRLVTLAKYSCPVADVPVYNRRLRRDYAECRAWRRRAFARIAELRPAMVFIGQFSRREIKAMRADGTRDTVTYAEWRDGMTATLRTLVAAGTRPVIVRDSPFPRRDVPVCLSRATQDGRPASDCAVPRALAAGDRTYASERAAAFDVPGTALIDLTDEICGPLTCEAMRDGIVVYRDANHLSAPYVRRLAGAFARAARPLLGAGATP